MSEEYYQRQIKDLNLRIDNLEFQRNMKQEKIEQLQSNWNSLRELIDYQLKHNVGSSIDSAIRNHVYQEIKDNMNELESKNV